MAVLCASLALPAWAAPVPTPAQVQAAYRSSEARLLDRGGDGLQSLRVDMQARRLPWVALADISPALQQAVLLAEDQRFMRHGGVDIPAVATAGEKVAGWVWPTYEERAFDAFRAYYAYVPKGRWSVEYTVRLNNAGDFSLPATRIEAMYAPEMFGESPNANVQVAQ